MTVLARRKVRAFVPIFFTGPHGHQRRLSLQLSARGDRVSGRLSRQRRSGKSTRTDFYTWTNGMLPDMSGLLVVAGSHTADPQVWLLSYPSGTMRAITNDLDQHRAIGLNDEADKFVTVVASGLVNVWVAPEGDAKQAVQVPVGNLGFYGAGGNSAGWTPDGRIVFPSMKRRIDLWMDPDGGNRKQLRQTPKNLAP